MLFLLPAYIESDYPIPGHPHRTAIVIVPLVALIYDLVARCRGQNLSYAQLTSPTSIPTTSLVFVSAETAAIPIFWEKLEDATSQKRMMYFRKLS